MTRVALVFAMIAAASGARADDFGPQSAPAPQPERPAAPAPKASRSWLDLGIGFEGGGAPFLKPPNGPVALSTATRSASLFARIAIPVLSSRTVEVGWIPDHGASLVLQSGDLRLGPVKLHLLDLGVFHALEQPLTVSRVQRKWDAVLGAGAEVAVLRHVALVVDARLFVPVDLWDVVTRYGDTARLIGEELVHGAQVWAGAAYRW
jgi:hypothetical protein